MKKTNKKSISLKKKQIVKKKSAKVISKPKMISKKTRIKSPAVINKQPDIVVKKKRVFYWSREIDLKIGEYNLSPDGEERERIFRTYLEHPLDKMAENIINRFKFPYMEGGYHEVKKQVIGFLVMNLSKYTPEKGKSFSYFSVIAKNYLILHNNIGYKAEKNTVYLSDIQDEESTNNSIEELPDLQTNPIEDIDRLNFKEFTKLLVRYWEKNIPILFQKPRDADIAYGIIDLIKQADKIENHSKKAAFLFLREMTNSKTIFISKIVVKMRAKILRQLYEYKTEGKIKEDIEEQFFQY